MSVRKFLQFTVGIFIMMATTIFVTSLVMANKKSDSTHIERCVQQLSEFIAVAQLDRVNNYKTNFAEKAGVDYLKQGCRHGPLLSAMVAVKSDDRSVLGTEK